MVAEQQEMGLNYKIEHFWLLIIELKILEVYICHAFKVNDDLNYKHLMQEKFCHLVLSMAYKIWPDYTIAYHQ